LLADRCVLDFVGRCELPRDWVEQALGQVADARQAPGFMSWDAS